MGIFRAVQLSMYQNSVGSHDFLTRLARSVSAKVGRVYIVELGQNAKAAAALLPHDTTDGRLTDPHSQDKCLV